MSVPLKKKKIRRIYIIIYHISKYVNEFNKLHLEDGRLAVGVELVEEPVEIDLVVVPVEIDLDVEPVGIEHVEELVGIVEAEVKV